MDFDHHWPDISCPLHIHKHQRLKHDYYTFFLCLFLVALCSYLSFLLTFFQAKQMVNAFCLYCKIKNKNLKNMPHWTTVILYTATVITLFNKFSQTWKVCELFKVSRRLNHIAQQVTLCVFNIIYHLILSLWWSFSSAITFHRISSIWVRTIREKHTMCKTNNTKLLIINIILLF